MAEKRGGNYFSFQRAGSAEPDLENIHGYLLSVTSSKAV